MCLLDFRSEGTDTRFPPEKPNFGSPGLAALVTELQDLAVHPDLCQDQKSGERFWWKEGESVPLGVA